MSVYRTIGPLIHGFSDVEHDLEGNYCRNPGFGTEPWCYTNAVTCHRAYCDSCQLRKFMKR